MTLLPFKMREYTPGYDCPTAIFDTGRSPAFQTEIHPSDNKKKFIEIILA
jgi:hypothetical protein